MVEKTLKIIGLALVHVLLFVAVEASPIGEKLFPIVKDNWLISLAIIMVILTGFYRKMLK